MGDCDIQGDDVLLQLRHELLSLRCNPVMFIRKIFGSDKIWVDRCSSIILPRERDYSAGDFQMDP